MSEDSLRSVWEKTVPPKPGWEAQDPLLSYSPASERTPVQGDEPASLAPAEPTAGLAGFEILAEIGRGGMGVVHRARQKSLDREVAVKRVLDCSDEDLRARFTAEALVTGLLAHPNIVPVHELGSTQEGDAFLVMKLIGGTSWREVLHPQSDTGRALAARHDLAAHLRILLSVCNAIAFAHSKGIVHRDL